MVPRGIFPAYASPGTILLGDRSQCYTSPGTLLLDRRTLRRLVGRLVRVGRALVRGELLGCADADRRLLLLWLDDRQAHLALLALRSGVDHDGGAGGQLLTQHEVGQRVLDVALDRAAQRTCAHRRVPPLL